MAKLLVSEVSLLLNLALLNIVDIVPANKEPLLKYLFHSLYRVELNS